MKNRIYLIAFTLLSMLIGNAQKKTLMVTDLEFKTHTGQIVKLNELKGKVVLLDFWYRGCLPCLKAIPDLVSMQDEFKNDLVIIGVNDFDSQEDVNAYFTFKNVNYLSTYKTQSRIYMKMGVKSFPTVILIDRQGDIVHADSGFSDAGMRRLKQAIKKVIRKK